MGPTRDDAAIARTLSAIGAALSSGDAAAVASFWDVPAILLADQGGRGIESREEITAFFREAIRWYREAGTPAARADRSRIEWMSDRVAAVSVDWVGADSDGVERGRESSFYLVRVGDDGVARIHVALARLPAGAG